MQRSIQWVCCLSEAEHSEVNLIIHVSCYSFSSTLSWREPSANEIIQLVYSEGRSKGSEPHLAQGWETFVFIGTDRAAPLAALLSLLSLGKRRRRPTSGRKSLCTFRQGEDKSTQQSWRGVDTGSSMGNTAHSRPLDLATAPLTGYVKITGSREETRAVIPVNHSCQQSLPRDSWKDKDPHSHVSSEKRKRWETFLKLHVLGGNQD